MRIAAQHRQHGAGQLQGGADVEGEQVVELCLADLLQQGEAIDPGSIDQQVGAAHCGGCAEHRLASGGRAQVGHLPDQRLWITLPQGGQGTFVAAHRQHPRAGGAQLFRQLQADAAAGAGEHHAAVRQSHGAPRR
ncbi:hypothetical protein D3C81_1395120 [compost metagenome]